MNLVRGQRDVQHHWFRAEIESPVCLVAIPDAMEFERAIFVGSLFDAHELPVLPSAVNQGRGRLSSSFHDVLGLALLLGTGGAEIDAAKKIRR